MARPPFQYGDPERVETAMRCVWALLEMARDSKTGPRLTVRNASKRLAEKIGGGTILKGWSAERLHAQKRRATDPAFASFADDELAGLRERRAERGWNWHPLSLLLDL